MKLEKSWETGGWLDLSISVVGIGVLAIVLVAALCIIAAIPTYFLWNWLMPEIFGLKLITLWQAVGINFLTAILFRSTSFNKRIKAIANTK